MECRHCKNTFSSKYVLLNHQKTAKFCKKLQTNHIEEKCSNKLEYSCSSNCSYKTTRKDHIEKHKINCIHSVTDILKDEIKLKNSTIDALNSQLCEKNDIILKMKEDETIKKLRDKILVLETKLEVVYKFQERSTSCVEEIAKQPKISGSGIQVE
jgi:hypothetical protein